jgi:hypothetical protein
MIIKFFISLHTSIINTFRNIILASLPSIRHVTHNGVVIPYKYLTHKTSNITLIYKL